MGLPHLDTVEICVIGFCAVLAAWAAIEKIQSPSANAADGSRALYTNGTQLLCWTINQSCVLADSLDNATFALPANANLTEVLSS